MAFSRGVWIWYLSKIRKDHISALKDSQVTRIYLKVLDGRSQNVFWNFQCSEEIIRRFNKSGIEVYGWGYHYGDSNIKDELDAIERAIDAGIAGYVFDLEAEVEDKKKHKNVEKLMKSCRPLFKNGNMGYTSFGHPGFHKDVPWKILNKYCDFAKPQIYFEKFTFGGTNSQEVAACLNAHKEMQLDKPIYPIWGSESDAKDPASAEELQGFLYSYPGSSVWRAPNRGESGEAWNLIYTDPPAPFLEDRVGEDRVLGLLNGEELPVLERYLSSGLIGDDVRALEEALSVLQIDPGAVDGNFDESTKIAVRQFQRQANIAVDGIVGPETWSELGGAFEIKHVEDTKRNRLADIAQREGALGLRWNGPESEAEKYLKPLRAIMQKLGHIGSKPVFYNWCAAFVTWCCREAGFKIPDQPQGYWASIALVQSWKYWAKAHDYWHDPKTTVLMRGDIVVFEWFDGDSQLDHIGVVSSHTPGSSYLRTSEGNWGKKTKNGTRQKKNVMGIVRILD